MPVLLEQVALEGEWLDPVLDLYPFDGLSDAVDLRGVGWRRAGLPK
jgi:hypothetical protein